MLDRKKEEINDFLSRLRHDKTLQQKGKMNPRLAKTLQLLLLIFLITRFFEKQVYDNNILLKQNQKCNRYDSI